MVSQGSSLGLVPSVTIGECRARPAVGPAPPPVACSPNRRSFEQCTHSPCSQVLGFPGHRPRASLSPATPPAAGAAPDADVQVTGIWSTVPLAQGKAAPGPRGPLTPLSAQSQGHQGRVSVIPQKRELGPQGDRWVADLGQKATSALPTVSPPRCSSPRANVGLTRMGLPHPLGRNFLMHLLLPSARTSAHLQGHPPTLPVHSPFMSFSTRTLDSNYPV